MSSPPAQLGDYRRGALLGELYLELVKRPEDLLERKQRDVFDNTVWLLKAARPDMRNPRRLREVAVLGARYGGWRCLAELDEDLARTPPSDDEVWALREAFVTGVDEAIPTQLFLAGVLQAKM